MQYIVRILQNGFNLGYVEPNKMKCVKRYRTAIERVSDLFAYLGLAKPDKESPLGWRPTPTMLSLLNKQPERKSKLSDKPMSVEDRLLMELLLNVLLDDAEKEKNWLL